MEEKSLCLGECFVKKACLEKMFLATSDRTNKDSVRAIQKSIFTVCLDAPMLRVSDEMYLSRVAAQMLHGGGTRWNSGNRWFDKTLQVSEFLRIIQCL